jgi:hypothetical protein
MPCTRRAATGGEDEARGTRPRGPRRCRPGACRTASSPSTGGPPPPRNFVSCRRRCRVRQGMRGTPVRAAPGERSCGSDPKVRIEKEDWCAWQSPSCGAAGASGGEDHVQMLKASHSPGPRPHSSTAVQWRATSNRRRLCIGTHGSHWQSVRAEVRSTLWRSARGSPDRSATLMDESGSQCLPRSAGAWAWTGRPRPSCAGWPCAPARSGYPRHGRVPRPR